MKRPDRKALWGKYEAEASDRRSTGSVSIEDGAWWTADLVVSIRREDQILLMLQRHGALGREEPDESMELCLRLVDVDALPVLLSGVISQARRDGVLPRRGRVGRQR